ncbi:MAG: MFS transporter, partial [Promethearchaeota archaeon]
MDDNFNNARGNSFKSIWRLYFMLAYCLGILPVNIENLLIYLPGATPSGIGLVTASRLAVGICSVLFFGYFGEKLANKFSRKKIFLCTNLVWIISYGLISLSVNFYFYFILAVISAIGAGAFIPIGFSILADYYEPKERGSKYSLMAFGMIIGSGAGIIFGGLLGNYTGPLGWRFAYALGGILGILAIISYYTSAIDPERGRVEPEFEDLNGQLNYNYKITYHQLTQLLKKKSILAIFLYVLCSGIANATLSIWAIFYITTKINDINANFYATTIYILAGIGAIPGTLLGGKFGDSLYHSGKLRGRIIISSVGVLIGVLCLLGFYLIPFKMETTLDIVLSWIFFITIGFFGNFFAS